MNCKYGTTLVIIQRAFTDGQKKHLLKGCHQQQPTVKLNFTSEHIHYLEIYSLVL